MTVLRDAFQRVTGFCAAITDGIFTLLILLAGLMAWSPAIGFEAAREAVAARRERRSIRREIRHIGNEVWGRQARRNSVAPAYYFAARSDQPLGDP
jgi:hypothetical protein